MTDDPYEVASSPERAFWADAVADAIEARDPDEPIVIKGGVSPSGVPHIGHFNEILRGYFVAEALRDRGWTVRQVFTADDKDALRAIPRTLANLDGEIVGLDEVDAGALGRNLGTPYTDIPDPFGCCDSYGDHFTTLLERHADAVGVPVDFVSNTERYAAGDFEPFTRHVLEHADEARAVLSAYQNKIDDDYVPFVPQCSSCGILTEGVTDVDLDAGTVSYVCTDREAGDDTISGCGHEGTVSLRAGKLPWRFEWPAQWAMLDVDFEPFGKDHAEGSWPSGQDIARNVFDIEPPVPMVYEWFTLDGGPFSSSAGNVVLVSDVLELVERDVLRYFFTKDPKRARDFSTERIDLLVDEFDRFERLYYGEVEDASEREIERAERIYPFVVGDVPEERPIRLPYTFAAVLGMTEDPTLREEIARREGHIPADASEAAIEAALERVERAREWAERTDNQYNYRIARREMPDVEVDEATATALDDLADFIESEDPDGETLQGEVYETAKRHDIDIGDFFTTGYRLFFDEEQGPKLGQFLADLDETFVVKRLRREA